MRCTNDNSALLPPVHCAGDNKAIYSGCQCTRHGITVYSTANYSALFRGQQCAVHCTGNKNKLYIVHCIIHSTAVHCMYSENSTLYMYTVHCTGYNRMLYTGDNSLLYSSLNFTIGNIEKVQQERTRQVADSSSA